jgi:hypothetical protein
MASTRRRVASRAIAYLPLSDHLAPLPAVRPQTQRSGGLTSMPRPGARPGRPATAARPDGPSRPGPALAARPAATPGDIGR